ncbi:MAG: hypothetical protein AB2A00_25315 [Myxococcota bacterium]
MRSLALLSTGMLAISCGGLAGPSCGGCAPANYVYPSKNMQGTEVVDDGVRARITERGLDFIAAHFKDILREQFPPDPNGDPNIARFPLPTQQFTDFDTSFGDLTICLMGNSQDGACPNPGNVQSAVTLDLNQLEDKITVDFIDGTPGGIRVVARDLLLGLDGRINTTVRPFDLFDTDAECDLHGETVLPGSFPPFTVGSIDITAEIYPSVSTDPAVCLTGAAQCFVARVQVTDAAINGVGLGVSTPPMCNTGDPRCSEACSDTFGFSCSTNACFDFGDQPFCPDPTGDCECRSFFCPVYGFGATILGQIADFLFTVLEPVLDNLFTAALNSALDQFNGQPLSFTGQVDVAAFAGGLVPGLSGANPLGFTMAPTNNAFSVTCPPGTNDCAERKGMDLHLHSGFEAVHDPQNERPSPSDCVPLVDGAKFVQLYQDVAFQAADGLPLNGEFLDSSNNARIYDLGASVARATLNQMGYAVHNAGVLCLSLDSYALHGISGGSFSLTAGALDLLTGGRLAKYTDPKSPVLLALAPAEPIVFTFGAGTTDDPHLQISMKEMHVSIYVMMYERHARVFEVTTDVFAGLNVNVDPVTHELTIAVASGPEIDNFQQVYNELLPDVDWSDLLPSLINVALGAILNQEISFNYDISPLLSDAMGGVPVYLVFEALQTEAVNGQREFLNLYLSLSETDPNPLTIPVQPRLQPSSDVQTWYRDLDGVPRASGMARLIGPLEAPLPTEIRYSYKVDFGPWHDWVAPAADGHLYVEDSKLGLVGEHTVYVRAMKAGHWGSLSEEPEVVKVWTDPAPPRVWLNRAEGRVAVRAEDRVARPEQLQMRWRVDGGEWKSWSEVQDIDEDELEGAYVLEVQARDPAGNVSEAEVLGLRSSERPVTSGDAPAAESTSQQSDGCVCAQPSERNGLGAAMVLAGLVLVRVRRRR